MFTKIRYLGLPARKQTQLLSKPLKLGRNCTHQLKPARVVAKDLALVGWNDEQLRRSNRDKPR
jgi:hypothetical protein